MKLVLILALSLSCSAQIAIKGSVGFKGSITIPATANNGGVPSGVGWHELSSTALTSACVATAHAATGCPTGNFAYSGGVGDTSRSRLCFEGDGGHADSSDPNSYCLNAASSPATITAITNFTGLTARDCSNYSPDVGNTVTVSSNPPTGATGACSDTAPATGITPSSSHTYQNTVYSPSTDCTFKFEASALAGSGGNTGNHAIWKRCNTATSWTLLTTTSSMGTVTGFLELACVENPNDNFIYCADGTNLWKYNTGTGAETNLNSSFTFALNHSGMIDVTNNVFIIMGNYTSADMIYVKLDGLDSYAEHDVSAGSAATCSVLMNAAIPGLAWDSVAHEIVGYPMTPANGNKIFSVNYSAGAITCTPYTMLGADTVTAFDGGTNAFRFTYVPTIDAFLACPLSTANCYGLRRR